MYEPPTPPYIDLNQIASDGRLQIRAYKLARDYARRVWDDVVALLYLPDPDANPALRVFNKFANKLPTLDREAIFNDAFANFRDKILR